MPNFLRASSLPVALALAASVVLSACGGAVYSPARDARFSLDPQAEINDEDVRKAFDARPQLGKPVRIAYYSFDPERVEALDQMLRAQAGVADVYRIPPLMVDGSRRYDQPNPWEPKEPFSIKKARLLAARAKCDLLLIFDNGHRIETSANGWVASTVLVLPLLFAPFLDTEVESYLETYLIDTRNGYLYAHVATDQKGQADTLTIYSSAADQLVEGQWARLMADTKAQLTRVMQEEWARTAAAGAAQEQPPKPAELQEPARTDSR